MRGEGGGGGGEGGDGRPEDGLVPRPQSRAALAPRHALARQREGGGGAAQRSARARRLLLVLGRDDAEEGRGARRLRSRRLAISLSHRLERERDKGQRTSLREASRPHQPCNLHPRPDRTSFDSQVSLFGERAVRNVYTRCRMHRTPSVPQRDDRLCSLALRTDANEALASGNKPAARLQTAEAAGARPPLAPTQSDSTPHHSVDSAMMALE